MKRLDRKNSQSGDGAESDDVKENSSLLSMQNKVLIKEIKRYKRDAIEQRKELELMRAKSREMESLVSIIHRSWAQLEVDTSLLLDALGDSEVTEDNNLDKVGLFRLFLDAGSNLRKKDATDTSSLYAPMKIDQWSSPAEIETARKSSLKSIDKNKNDSTGDVMSVTESEEDLGSKLEEHLSSHSSFTLTLLERLCIFINESLGENGLRSPESLKSLENLRCWSTEKLMMQDKIDKLTVDLINIQADHHLLKLEKNRADKIIDKLKDEISELKESTIGKDLNKTDGATDVMRTNESIEPKTHPISSTLETELLEKIAILERQLTESETAKSKVEMTLTERLARPLTQTEAQISDMRKSMEELRQQFKQRVSSLIAEGNALQDKVYDQEMMIIELESSCAKKCDIIMSQTQHEINTCKQERDKIQSSLLSAQAELTVLKKTRTELEEQKNLMKLTNEENQRLKEQIIYLNESVSELQGNLRKSRERESSLELLLASSDQSELSTALKSSIDRANEIQKELDNVKAHIDDLIMEIESVSESEKKCREQSSRVLEQSNNNQNMQRGVLEENLRLHDSIEEAKNKLAVAESKMAIALDLSKQQDKIIGTLRQEEQKLRIELNQIQKDYHLTKSNNVKDEQSLLEAQQKCSIAEHAIEAAKKRNMELQARCGELSKKLESERKLRMELQRDNHKSKKNETKESVVTGLPATHMSKEDVEMLEITLGMLRCSVCRDRFKEVALTRCFHLFCKECIDENIKNRNRKCPACGEKFGHDDVKTIYFTH